MARVKISEYKAKQLVYNILNFPPDCFSISSKTNNKIPILDPNKRYVIKVDQGVKGRFKKGLVAIDKKTSEVEKIIDSYTKLGFSSLFIEEYIAHEKDQEKYLSIDLVREGKLFLYSNAGGIDIEKHKENIKKKIVKTVKDIDEIARYLEIDKNFLEKIFSLFDQNYFSFLEINPLVVIKDRIYILDLAVEVDSTAQFFVKRAFDESDFILEARTKTKEEESILNLSQKSQAAFRLDILNPNGSIFMLLSGGGASIVLADEVANQGFGKELANYGEYSGNPNKEETYIYTKNLLSLLLKSNAMKKVLIIGGGVANFTDIRITFKGVIQALDEVKKNLVKQKVKVFVRRGGPHQEEGLLEMRNFLGKEDLLGKVEGPKMVLTDIVLIALKYLEK
ncbi:MAG: hypothetical protein HY344_02735 [Candidatus Levybacteria bacterium]|nr:hypothetical protein [Candidatus Levybacteria bacterium]